MNQAVILLAYGGPDSLDDIPEYLLDIRGGRPTSQELIDDITDRYRQIGGRSPLLDITNAVADKVAAVIDRPVYVGMRHWSPYIADVIGQMAADGIDHIVAICMAPHCSTLSIGKYREKVQEALDQVQADTGRNIGLSFVDSWHTQPAYLGGVAGKVRQTLAHWPASESKRVKVIFTAHSLPSFILERGDPYDDQLRETAGLLAEMLGLAADRWTFSYQSAAQTGMPWLGPQIEDLVPELAANGERDLLIAPIGFISDHVEILYDIDIGVQAIASAHGVRVERAPMLNACRPLIVALSALARTALESSARDASAKDVSAKDVSAKDASAKDVSAKEPSVLGPTSPVSQTH
ncbi:MAG: ferrochelatase [Chloroflexota bacterium]|nr:MAG: ferrochelatase [Chloroflexota bacterium]